MKFSVSFPVLCIVFCVTKVTADLNHVLIEASKGHDLDIIKRMIQKGANINAADDDGWTALHFSSFGQIDVVKYLVQNGADINAKTRYGKTALDLALRWDYPEVAEFLRNAAQSATTPSTAVDSVEAVDLDRMMLDAAGEGDLDTVKRLIEQGVNINATNKDHWTILHFSAFFGRLNVVKYLIQNDETDINAKDIVGYTPLHLSSLKGKLDVVKYLVAKEADVEAKNSFGQTAQDVASAEGQWEVAEFLENAAKSVEFEQERTLILLKPETIQRKLVGKIIEQFEDSGLKLVALKLIRATKEMVEHHSGNLENRIQYDEMVRYMTSGPIVPMVWEGKNAIEKTLKLIEKAESERLTPGTTRNDFSGDALHNIIHCSISTEAANREIDIWFHEDEMISWTAADE